MIRKYSTKKLDTINDPVKSYRNLNDPLVQSTFFRENRGKAGIYLWRNLINGNTYVGSSIDLSKRFLKYFNYNALKRNNMLISLAILKHKLENFSLDVLEYCDAHCVLEREQHYLDTLLPQYNVLKTAGSPLGFVHSESTLSKLRGRIASEETLQLQRDRVQSKETREKIKLALSIPVEVTDMHKEEVVIYPSKKDAGFALNVADTTVGRYMKTGKLCLDRYLIKEVS